MHFNDRTSLHCVIQVARSLYEKRAQAHVRSKLGNNAKIVTREDYDHPDNVKAFADWHDNKKGSLGGRCPAYDIALEADFVEESDSGKPSQPPQISTIVFRDTRTCQRLERLMQGYASAKISHPREANVRTCFVEINKKKIRPNDTRSKSINQSLASLG